MSIKVLRVLICDECGDPYCDVEPGFTGTEQREDAKQDGWSVNRKGGLDLCEACVAVGGSHE